MTYKLTTGAAATIFGIVIVFCGTQVIYSSSQAVAESCAVVGFLALMLFAGSVMEGILKK